MTDLPTRCKCRKQAVTSLRCSRCFVPICPDCSQPAAVGMMCTTCLRGNRNPVYTVKANEMLEGGFVAFASAIFGGWLLSSLMGFGFFYFWFCYLYGWGIAELTLRATSRKRGTPMEILAGSATGLGIVAGWVVAAILSSSDIADALSEGFRNPWSYIAIGLAVFAAVSRIRHL